MTLAPELPDLDLTQLEPIEPAGYVARGQALLDALRSGEYPRTEHMLTERTPNGLRHCALGVAIQIYLRYHDDLLTVDLVDDSGTRQVGYYPVGTDSSIADYGSVPKRVAEWYGWDMQSGPALVTSDGYGGSEVNQIPGFNDDGMSWDDIADLLEAQWLPSAATWDREEGR